MGKTIGLIVATKNAIQPGLEAFARYAPGIRVQLFVDEGLLPAVEAAGGVTPAILRRFVGLLARAEESGVDGILFSCTVFSPSLGVLEPFFPIPLASVDGAMLNEAVSEDGTVGVISTVRQTEKMVVEQMEERARRNGKRVTIRSLCVPEAFAALSTAPELHDSLVYDAGCQLVATSDRIVLAQMSMARVADKIAALGKPVLTSLKSSVLDVLAKIG